MARGTDVIEVEVFENQRYFPLQGWGGAMLPTDRPKWSSRDGRVEKNKVDNDAAPPRGYLWASDWELIINHHDDETFSTTDHEGWCYAFDFPAEYHPHMGGHSWVRRRRWMRRVVVDPAQEDQHTPSGHLVDDGAFVLIDDDDGGEAATDDHSASGSAVQPRQQQRGSGVGSSSTGVGSLDSCAFPESSSVSGAHTPTASYKFTHSPSTLSDPANKVVAKWMANKGQRNGSVAVTIHEVHLAKEFQSCSVLTAYHTSYKQRSKPQPATGARCNFESTSQQHHIMITSDYHPLRFTVFDESAGPASRRCVGGALLSLRSPATPEPGRGETTFTALPDGRYSEHGKRVELQLFPPLSGTGVGDDSLYRTDMLGTITVSWTFDLRDGSGVVNLPQLDFCDRCGSTVKRCKCDGGSSPTGSSQSVDSPTTLSGGEVPPETKKSGRLYLYVMSGTELIDHSDSTGNKVTPYLREKSITPYVALHYAGLTTPTPAMEACTDATRHQMVKTAKASGDARDSSDVIWGETLVVDVADIYSSEVPLRVEVWDYFTFESNKFMGHAYIDPIRENGKLVQLKLAPRDNEQDGFVLAATGLGVVSVRIFWVPFTL